MLQGMPSWCAENRLGPRGDRICDAVRINIRRIELDVDKDRGRAAIPDRVSRRKEGVTDGDDFVAGLDAEGDQGQVQRRGAARYCARLSGANRGRELAFEGGDFGPLRQPAAENRAPRRIRLPLVHPRTSHGNHRRTQDGMTLRGSACLV